jgi:hypothetical protein
MSSLIIISLKEEFEDNKGVIRIQKKGQLRIDNSGTLTTLDMQNTARKQKQNKKNAQHRKLKR